MEGNDFMLFKHGCGNQNRIEEQKAISDRADRNAKQKESVQNHSADRSCINGPLIGLISGFFGISVPVNETRIGVSQMEEL